MKKVIAMALAMMMVLSFAACESAEKVEESAPETKVEETTNEAEATVDLAAQIETMKAASDKVVEITTEAVADGLNINVTMAADASEDDVNTVFEAVKTAADDEAFVKEILFESTEESLLKSYFVNFMLGEGTDVAYTASATYSSGMGRKGMLYTRTVAWSAPEAPAAE